MKWLPICQRYDNIFLYGLFLCSSLPHESVKSHPTTCLSKILCFHVLKQDIVPGLPTPLVDIMSEAPASPAPSAGHNADIIDETDISTGYTSRLARFQAALTRLGGPTPSIEADPVAVVAERDLGYRRYMFQHPAYAVSK